MDEFLENAIALFNKGDKHGAGMLFSKYVKEINPNNELAWMYLAFCVIDNNQKKYCIERALQINPNYQQAKDEYEKIIPQQLPDFSFENSSNVDIKTNNTTNKNQLRLPQIISKLISSLNNDDKFFKRFIIGLSLFAVFIITLLIIYFLNSPSGIPAKAKEQIKSFIAEAQKLNIMTNQGVNYNDFQSQLINVKTSYSFINYNWEGINSSAKADFDKAIDAWDASLFVWKKEIANSLGKYGYFSESEARQLAAKWNLNGDNAVHMFFDKWLSYFLTIGSDNYMSGWNKINSKIQ